MRQLIVPIFLIYAACAAGQSNDIWTDAIRRGGGGQQQQQQAGQRRAVPNGFKVAGQAGSGQALIGVASGRVSARAAFSNILRHVSSYFDGAPALQSAFADPRDEQVQAFFRGGFQGGPVQGLMTVSVTGGNVYAVLLFDRPDQFSRSLPALTRQVTAALSQGPAGGGGSGPARIPPMNRTPLPDGSGAVDLPQGYVITGAFKGTVDIVGPQGQQVSLGGYQSVFMQGYQGSTLMYGPYRPPFAAFQLWTDCTYKGVLSRGEVQMRQLERSPQQFPNGQAEMFTYEVSHPKGRVRGLVYASSSRIPSDISLWMYYASFVNAPADRFAQDLPTLWAIWKSWTVNPAVFRERMDAALQSMRETFSIMQAGNANQARAGYNGAAAWDQTIRGVTAVQNVVTGGRQDINTNHAQNVVDELNRQGYQYRIVPTNELTQ